MGTFAVILPRRPNAALSMYVFTHTKEHTGNHAGNLWVGSAVLILNGQKLKENRWTTWVAGFRSQYSVC